MTRSFLVVLGIVAVIAMVVLPAQAEPIKITYANYLSEKHISSVADTQWCQEVEKRADGRVKFEWHYGGSLFNGPELLKAVQSGVIQMANIAPGYYINQMPLAGGLQTVFLTEKPPVMIPTIVDLARDYEPFQKELAKNNLVLIQPTVIPETWVYMAKTPVNKLDDLKGKRIRAYGWLANALQLMEAIPVGLAFGEVYTSLERGVIDGFSGVSVEAVGSLGVYEPTKYFTDIGLGYYASSFLCINKETWEKLPQDIQKIMTDVSQGALERWLKIAGDQMNQYVKLFIDQGIKITQLDQAEREKAAALGGKVHQVWIDKQDKGVPAAEMMDKVKALIKQYEGQVDYNTSAWSIYQKLSGN